MRQVVISLVEERGGRRPNRYPFADVTPSVNDSFTAAADAAVVFSSTLEAANSFTAAADAAAAFSASLISNESFSAAADAAAAFVGSLVTLDTFTAAADASASFVAGGYRQITLPPSDPPPQSAAPTVIGGDPSMQLYIGGVNVTAFHMEEMANIQSQTIGRWTASVKLVDNTGTIAALFAGANGGRGLSITIQEYGFKLFAGCIQSVRKQRYLSSTSLTTFEITATDKSAVCDRRYVSKTLYPGASDAADVIRDIVTNYLDGEGITTVGVPLTLGALGSDLPFNFNYVRNAFDQIAALTATVWWVDPNGGLNFSALLDLPPAPFSLTETSRNWRGVADGQGIEIVDSLQDFATEVVAVSNLNIIPAAGSNLGPQVTESYVFGPNGQEAAFNAGLPFGYVLVNLPISVIVSLKINGVAKNPYNIDDPSSPPYGSAATDWYYYRNGQIVFPSFAPSVGQTIEIIYIPMSTNAAVETGEALSPAVPGLGQCGSGRYQKVVQVQDISTREDLNAIAAADLALSSVLPTEIRFRVIQHGLQPGMLLPVNIPDSGLTSLNLLVTAVAGHSVGATMGFNCTYIWDVTARTSLDPGNWVKYFERIIRRTEQAKPVVQLETHAIIIPSGSNLVGGVILGNPIPIERPGKLYAMRIAAGTPPQDQDLQITFTINGLPVGQITLPDSTAANFFVVELFDPANPQYVYTNDALNATALYINVGASPVAARNVTATISHAL